ncbi:MAG: hypothetical protein JSW71_06585, partial [Gemmatimonadota bacterium]
NTPLRQVMWSIRNNVNLQQSALLIAMNYVGTHREEFLRNFYRKSQRSVAKSTAEGPAAYVFPASDHKPGQQARLLQLLQRLGVEVHRADRSFTAEGTDYGAGSYVVRMDQPYSRAADMLLDKQYYNPNDPRPYDDVGWTLGPLYDAVTVRVEDPAILSQSMTLVSDTVAAPGGIENSQRPVFLVRYNADNNLAAFRFEHPELQIEAAEQSFTVDDIEFGAGSFIIRTEDNPGDLAPLLEQAGARYGFSAIGTSSVPDVPTHPVVAPRVAVMHTWSNTQTEGWLRLGLDEYAIPYDYISVHEVRDEPSLIDKYDVIVMGPSSSNALSILYGVRGNRPLPWRSTELTPNLGVQDETDDMRGGLELEGVLNLANFIKAGGTFITIANSSSLPTHFGLTPGLGVKQTTDLWARGGVFRVRLRDRQSPLAYGYGDELGVYFNSAPVFQAQSVGGRRFDGFGPTAAEATGGPGSTTARRTGRGGGDEEDIVQGRARDMGQAGVEQFRSEDPSAAPQRSGAATAPSYRTVLAFATDPEELLISGGIMNGQEMAGAPALVDVPLGDGHVIMFSFNPFWRSETLGSYALLFNAFMHHGNLSPATPIEEVAPDSSGARR